MSGEKSVALPRMSARAFSLIELLVAVAIIALLVALLLPGLRLARKQAERLRCASHLRAFGDACSLYRTARNRYPQVAGPPRVTGLSNIGGVAQELVRGSLGKPGAMYCPISLERDVHSTPPLIRESSSGAVVEHWKTGQISYLYLPGVVATYPLPDDTITFDHQRESPDNPRNVRAVLAGDRTVDTRQMRNVAGSNHGREGGWFYFVAGDMQWWDWPRLTVHPTENRYHWYWPRTIGRPLHLPPPSPE